MSGLTDADYTACGVRLIAPTVDGETFAVPAYCDLPVNHEGLHFVALEFTGAPESRIAQTSVAARVAAAEQRITEVLDRISDERREAVRINRDPSHTRTRRDAAEHYAGGLAEAERIIRAALGRPTDEATPDAGGQSDARPRRRWRGPAPGVAMPGDPVSMDSYDQDDPL